MHTLSRLVAQALVVFFFFLAEESGINSIQNVCVCESERLTCRIVSELILYCAASLCYRHRLPHNWFANTHTDWVFL